MTTTAVESPPIVCSRCGAVSTRVGAKFCASCGQPLGKSSGGGWLIVAIITTLSVIVSGAMFFTVGSRTMTTVTARPAVAAVTVDLTSSPAALLQGGPPADQMSLSGLSLGSYLPADRRIDGNEFLVADQHVSQIAIGRPDILRACRVRAERDIPYQFGSDFTAVQRDGAFASYDYARRGILVEWDARMRRINRLILRPANGG